jgi:hypothetical protein
MEKGFRPAAYSPRFAHEQRRAILHVRKCAVTKNETLKSKTLRFTESDIHLLESLRKKLRLGMNQVIRVAIMRLAEIEHLSACSKKQ